MTIDRYALARHLMDQQFGVGIHSARHAITTNAVAKRIYDCAIEALARELFYSRPLGETYPPRQKTRWAIESFEAPLELRAGDEIVKDESSGLFRKANEEDTGTRYVLPNEIHITADGYLEI